MVYLDNFEEFMEASAVLFAERPLRTRYLIKYRHADKIAVLKVTDNRVCLKWKTSMLADLKNIEKFTQAYARWMTLQDLNKIEEPDTALQEAKEEAKGSAKKKRRH
eukprot:TRINITY_DN21651_c0_g1_i1.p1 TRINITY_DN21651_c0_g1~~TRINITY_DN21651_c0_g1_i1.p1  ORF type:complete len:106 (-),score=22.29 TRINITY_DN21651_c0_g1_i1:119-436(-)